VEYTVTGGLYPSRIGDFDRVIGCIHSQDMISFQQIAKKLIF